MTHTQEPTMADTAASPLSEERVREIEQEMASVAGGYGFTDEMAYDLAAMMRELLADRTALTARLEAVERENAMLKRSGFEMPPERHADWGEPLRYLSDDRDDPQALELQISRGGNGDWYISTPERGKRTMRGVRIATSGGAAFTVPKLVGAIVDAYDALHFAKSRS